MEFRQSLVGEKTFDKMKHSVELQVIQQLSNDSSYETNTYLCVMSWKLGLLETILSQGHFVD